MNSRPNWTKVRAQLSAIGFRPSRRLGQNFLLDENMVNALVRDAGVGPGSKVLEVGVGCGFLTLPLAEAGAELVAAEIDERVLEVAREIVGERDAVRYFLGDALAGKHQLNPELEAMLWREDPWMLVANLPYSVSAPLMAVLAELDNPPQAMHALVQLEVAERIAAPHGTSDWGPLSVRLQASYTARVGREVPPGLFWPRPRVSSAVVVLERRPDPPPRADRDQLAALAAGLFQRRRQNVGRVLGDLLGDKEGARALLAAEGIDPTLRAERLPLEAFLALSRTTSWRGRRA
jgi:16S rRNA (adenine1518-N6/adenine1519-N6)-dimethyltransferase